MSEATEYRPTWKDYIEVVAPDFNQIANREKLVVWEEECLFALQAVQSNDHLAKCNPVTVQNSIKNVAAVGLTLNPALGYAYLVPEKGECNLKLSFKGLIKIATDSGSIMWCKAEIVKAADSFIYNGPCALPVHNMNPFSERGEIIGAYCIAKTHMGDFLVDVIDIVEINKIQSSAKTQAIWQKWREEMIKKAIIKRSSKQWPKTDRTDRLEHAIAFVNDNEGSEPITSEPNNSPRQPIQRMPEPITNERLASAIEKIKTGEFSLEKLNRNFVLTQEQASLLDAELQVPAND